MQKAPPERKNGEVWNGRGGDQGTAAGRGANPNAFEQQYEQNPGEERTTYQVQHQRERRKGKNKKRGKGLVKENQALVEKKECSSSGLSCEGKGLLYGCLENGEKKKVRINAKNRGKKKCSHDPQHRPKQPAREAEGGFCLGCKQLAQKREVSIRLLTREPVPERVTGTRGETSSGKKGGNRGYNGREITSKPLSRLLQPCYGLQFTLQTGVARTRT